MTDEMKTQVLNAINERANVLGNGAYGDWKVLSLELAGQPDTDGIATYIIEAEANQGVEKFEVETDELLVEGRASDDIVSGINGMILMYEGFYDEDA